MISHYDDVVFQTARPGLTTVRWKKVTVVSNNPVDVSLWTTDQVVEVENGNYFIHIPIEDTDPDPLLLVLDTGDLDSVTRVVKALDFDPSELVEVESGGGVLMGRIADSSLAPDDYLEIVQGEEKVVTFIVQAQGRFNTPTAGEITVMFRDVEGTVVTVENSSIERVCQESDIQVIRVPLTPEQTQPFQAGLLRIQIAFDDQMSVLTHALKILEGIAPVGT